MFRHSGVSLKPSKKPLVITRLRKRLEELNCSKFEEYLALLDRPQSDELVNFVNAITTNETYFFRHSRQFNYLYETALPAAVKAHQSGSNEIKIWSAACSSGEEPYSIAMTCQEFIAGGQAKGMNIKIYASDINSEVIGEAKQGVFSDRSLRETPASFQKKYFKAQTVQMVTTQLTEYVLDEKIRSRVEFLQHNLLKPFPHKNLDVVFLRNVMIYFEEDTKMRVVQLIEDAMAPGGYLFISLSESINYFRSKFKYLNAGIYQKQ
jgi:chemotaxis protein methyltransferase CheR